jgi:hypothetical protein
MPLDIPSDLFNIIVPLECVDTSKFIGTSFLLECFCAEDDERIGLPILVTNRHVVEDEKIQFRVNLREGNIIRIKIGELISGLTFNWVFHPDKNIDLAIVMIPAYKGQTARGLSRLMIDNVNNYSEGREIFHLGFPLAKGAEPDVQHKPILRTGIIAQKNDGYFLIEANVFPGSSGSPVFIKPRININDKEETIIEQMRLVGVVSEYIAYQDVAISRQTGRPRIVFEDNSGLAQVFNIQHIKEIVDSTEFEEQANPIIEQVETKTKKKLIKKIEEI